MKSLLITNKNTQEKQNNNYT